ncbi:hypothetical protein [Streptomyces mangrovisoli]|uniref:Secreted protein n=1 Tax=Streptomyces mangrovisoli TaxID=1428628 RepID=A0A1J4NM38_9ACTN|nr:hypothetical protein [Streptomyces mangrovisoli]OIJ63391.1 hypothetical protein WN71_034635 [Streptomyces mangrovisoli]
MRSRGRHRRRRRGRALRAFLTGTALALTAAATMISASQATVTAGPGALKPLTSSAALDRLTLREELQPQRSLDRLASAMGRPVGVDTVLADADRTLRDSADCTPAEREALPAEPTATRAYCWDADDTRTWQPGAVTTSGDADDDGHWGTHRVILSGWSRHGSLARIAFVDADDPARLSYTWVLLTVPVDGGRDYRALASTVTGMVWYQQKLLVTAGRAGAQALYVYDLRRIQRATADTPAVGRVRGGWSAHGYRYVMPAVGSYELTGGACTARADSGTPCVAGIGLDRSTAPDSLVAAEAGAAGGDRSTRLWRYSFDGARGGLLATGATGRADATQAYETKAGGTGGVLSYRSGWYLGGTADEPDGHGTLWRQDTRGARAAHCGSDGSRRCWAGRPRSLSYWAETGEVWSQSGRTLFALPLASIDRALG